MLVEDETELRLFPPLRAMWSPRGEPARGHAEQGLPVWMGGEDYVAVERESTFPGAEAFVKLDSDGGLDCEGGVGIERAQTFGKTRTLIT